MGRKEGKFRALPRSGTSIQGPPLPLPQIFLKRDFPGEFTIVEIKKMDPEETDQNQIVH